MEKEKKDYKREIKLYAEIIRNNERVRTGIDPYVNFGTVACGFFVKV